jgi:SAM-dependent methyltransferase
MDANDWLADIRTSYDTVARSYADQMREALDGAPKLRAALDLFADAVHAAGGGLVADVGCGPGHVTAHLSGLGLDAFGVDVSPGMVEVARAEHPGLRFEVGTMTALDLADGSIAGALAFWSLVHLPHEQVPVALGEIARTLRPGAPLLIGYHAGVGSKHKTEGYGGHPMNVHVHRRRPARMSSWVREAGFTVESETLLDPDGSSPGAILVASRM